MFSLKATIDRIEEGKAVLIFEDNQQLIIEKDKLGQDIKEGQVIFFNLSQNKLAQADNEKIAKNLLQQILKKDG